MLKTPDNDFEASLDINRCLLCGNDNYDVAETIGDIQYVQCGSCGYFWQNPVKKDDEILQIYDRRYFEYAKHISNNSLALMKKSLDDLAFSEYASKNLKGRKFLDVGCSIGFAVKYFADQGWNATGIDICQEAIEYGKKEFNINLISADLFEADLPENYFNVVHSQHVIEHVINPVKWVNEIFRIIKPNGVIMITTPNISSFQRLYYKDKWRSYTPRHIQLFGKKQLRMIVENAGFKTLKHLTWGGIPQGATHDLIKSVADKAVKSLNIGDVQLILAVK